MSQKDFTDWNGRKRKAELRPEPERTVRRAGTRKIAGLKVKTDRYRQLVKELKRLREYQHRYMDQVRAAPPHERLRMWEPHYNGWARNTIRKLRQLQEEYRKDGSLERVRAELGLKGRVREWKKTRRR